MTAIPTKDDLSLLLKAETHKGSEKLIRKMAPYVFKKATDGKSYIIDLYKTFQKIRAAAQLLVTVRNPKDICLVASTAWAQRAIFKFGQYTKSYAVSGRFTPGTFTNQICKGFREPSVLIVSDPHLDYQSIKEASYVNIPVIACCDTDSPLEYVDLVIPCNNKNKNSIAAIFYLLTRELLQMRGDLTKENPFDVSVDLFIHKNVEELEKRIEEDTKKIEMKKKLAKDKAVEGENEEKIVLVEKGEDEEEKSVLSSISTGKIDDISEKSEDIVKNSEDIVKITSVNDDSSVNSSVNPAVYNAMGVSLNENNESSSNIVPSPHRMFISPNQMQNMPNQMQNMPNQMQNMPNQMQNMPILPGFYGNMQGAPYFPYGYPPPGYPLRQSSGPQSGRPTNSRQENMNVGSESNRSVPPHAQMYPPYPIYDPSAYPPQYGYPYYPSRGQIPQGSNVSSRGGEKSEEKDELSGDQKKTEM